MADLSQEEFLEEFEEMWKSATIGDTWKLNERAVQAYRQILGQTYPQVNREFVEKWIVKYAEEGGCLYVMPKK